MPLPESYVREVPPAGGFTGIRPRGIPVFVGVASGGTLVAKSFGARRYADIAAEYKSGPLARKAPFVAALSNTQCVCVRVPKTARSASKTAATVTKNASSTFTSTLTGTPTWGADIVIKAIVGGTTGTAGITYQVSLDGGETFSATAPLGTATTIVVLGVTLDLGSAKVVTAADTIAWFQRAASAAIGPVTESRVASSTGTVTPSGSPEDAYRWRLEFLSGGTAGTAGITYRYCLDWNGTTGTWSKEAALGTATTIALLDGGESSGLTLTLSGAFDTNDTFAGRTTEPEASWADISAALTAVRNGNLQWSFLAPLSPMSAADAASLDTLVTGWANGTRRTWAVVETRDREETEGIDESAARVLADFANFASTRVFPAAGHGTIACPITGRRDRRSASLQYLARLISATKISQDPGQVNLGKATVSIHDANGTLAEHDARIDPSLFDAGFLVLRTWEDSTLQGVYPAGGVARAPAGNLGLIAIRRVLDAVEDALQTQARMELLRGFRQWTELDQARNPQIAKRGDIYEPDARGIESRLYQAGYAAVIPSGDATRVDVTLSRTPMPLAGGKYGLAYSGKAYALGYIYEITGDVGLVDPAYEAA